MKTIEAVVGIVHDGNWFLLLKKKGNWVGWQFAQGVIDKKETEDRAVLREIKEETGLDAKIECKLDCKTNYWFVWEDEKIHKNLAFYLLSAKKTNPVILSEEHSEYQWIKKEKVADMLKYNKEVFEQVLKRYFK